MAVLVSRGPSLASCSDAIASAIVADIVAREQRQEAALERREEAFRAALRRPQSIALVDPQKVRPHPSE